jgi:hypothetical protein
LEGVQARSLVAVSIQANRLKRYGKQKISADAIIRRIKANKRLMKKRRRIKPERRHL